MDSLKLISTLCMFVIFPSLAEHPTSFSNAKKTAEREIYFDHFKTFYCGCDFEFDDKGDRDNDGNKHETMVHPESCGYTPRKQTTRSGKRNARIDRIEWEHVTPAHTLGGHLKAWQDPASYPQCVRSNGKAISGRDCAYEVSASFKMAHDDLHNLHPAVGELNGDRSNYPFANIEGEARSYGQCDFEVDFKNDIVEPPNTVKGNIARIYLYMNKRYKFPIHQDELNTLLSWNKQDPADDWECTRNDRIKMVQGNDNPFVTDQCKAKL